MIVRHSAAIFGVESEMGGWSVMPPLGIYILLAVSGYLLVGSWERRPRLVPYATARILRIMPSLFIVVVVTVFVLGPLLSTLSGQDYFGSALTWDYLGNVVFRLRYFLPGVFADNPYPDAVNGSLWSLPAQFAVAFFVPLLALVPWRAARGTLWLVLAVASAAASQLPQLALFDVWGSSPPDVLRVWPAFFVAAAIRELAGTLRPRWGIAAVLVLVPLHLFAPAAVLAADWIVVPVAVVALGSVALPVVSQAGRFGNPAFGAYLTGFPIQQSIVAVFGTEHALLSVLASIALALGFGYALNRGVEQPLVRLHRVALRRSRTRVPASLEAA